MSDVKPMTIEECEALRSFERDDVDMTAPTERSYLREHVPRLLVTVDDLRAEVASLKAQMSQFGEVVDEAWAFVTAPRGSGPHPAPKLGDAMARLISQSPTGEATGRRGACICPCHDTPSGPCRCSCAA